MMKEKREEGQRTWDGSRFKVRERAREQRVR